MSLLTKVAKTCQYCLRKLSSLLRFWKTKKRKENERSFVIGRTTKKRERVDKESKEVKNLNEKMLDAKKEAKMQSDITENLLSKANDRLKRALQKKWYKRSKNCTSYDWYNSDW